MSLKELQDENGDPCFVDPAEVVAIQRRDSIRTLSWLERRQHERLCVRGAPREVAAILFAQDDMLPRVAVAEALTHEHRMALGWDGMSEITKQRMHMGRLVVRSLADRLAVVLDERRINTPLEEK